MKIVATSPSFSKNEKLQREIYKHFPNAQLNLDGKKFNQKELAEFLGDADAVIVGLDPINEEILNECPNIKIIAKYGVGLNNIDLEACKKRNIAIGWTGGVNKLSVAEMALGFMLMFARNLFMATNELKNGVWNKSAGFQVARWDGTNNLGQLVSAGMYIYTIQAGSFRATKKMVLLK